MAVTLEKWAKDAMCKQQNQAFSNGSLSALQSLKSKVPSPDMALEQRMAVWSQTFKCRDPAVLHVFSHFLSTVDLDEILRQDQTWKSRVWTKELYMQIMDLKWQYTINASVLKQREKSPIKLKEELSRLWIDVVAQYKKLRQSRAIPVKFHITPDFIEVPRHFGRERRRPKRISGLEASQLDGLDLF